MSFCRGILELSSKESSLKMHKIYYEVTLILLILNENFHVTLFSEKLGKIEENFIFHNSCMSFASSDLGKTSYFSEIIFIIDAN